MKIELFFTTILFLQSLTKSKREDSEDDKKEQPVRTNLSPEANQTTFPINLSDSNQDGLLDEGDFIRGFSSTVLLVCRNFPLGKSDNSST